MAEPHRRGWARELLLRDSVRLRSMCALSRAPPEGVRGVLRAVPGRPGVTEYRVLADFRGKKAA